ncbi:MAG: Spore Coat Protein domain, partial [Pseudomonadota bacterium]
MNTSIKNVSKVLATAAFLASAGFVHAADAAPNGGSTTANLAVSASITAKCTISTTAVAFGAYDPVVTNSSTGSNVTQNGEVVVACTKRAGSLWVGLGSGLYADAGVRYMNGQTRGDKLAYSLKQPSSNTPDAS